MRHQSESCIDPSPFNNGLKHERYQMKTYQDILTDLSNAKLFSKCDLRHGYCHCVLDDRRSELSTFQSPIDGRYKQNGLPFGLSAPPELPNFDHKETVPPQHDGSIQVESLVAALSSIRLEVLLRYKVPFTTIISLCKAKSVILTDLNAYVQIITH